MGLARSGFAFGGRETLQKATYLHGELENQSSEECSPCLISWNQQWMLNSPSERSSHLELVDTGLLSSICIQLRQDGTDG